jgi:hypothetical protein
MKFYDAQMEGALLALAQSGLEQTGGRFQRKDRRLCLRFHSWLERLLAANSRATWWLLLICVLLLKNTPFASWQIFPGIMMMISVKALHRKFKQLALHSPTTDALRHLPIPGATILKWAREQALRHAFFLVVWAMTSAWWMAGFPVTITAALPLFAHGLLMLWLCLATVILLMHPWVVRSRLSPMWFAIITITVLLEFGMLFTLRQYDITVWTSQWDRIVSWLLPPLWAHPDRLLGWGGILALLWGLWGTWYWRRWPALAGRMFEAHVDWPNEEPNEKNEIFTDNEPPPVNAIASLKGIDPEAEGWIEQLAWRCLDARDRPVAAAFVKSPLRWSYSWHRAMVISFLAIGIIWLSRELSWNTDWQIGIIQWSWFLSLLVLVNCWPISNMIPGATFMWAQGNLQQPFYAGLPVSTRDLLRISTRLTLVRCTVFVVLVIPIFTAWAFVAQIPEEMSVLFATVFVLTVTWVLSRPAFVTWRLLGRVKEAYGTLWGQLGLLTIVFLIGMAWVFTGWFLILKIENLDRVANPWIPWVVVFFSVCFHGLFSRAIFEAFHWRLRTGKLDLIRPI